MQWPLSPPVRRSVLCLRSLYERTGSIHHHRFSLPQQTASSISSSSPILSRQSDIDQLPGRLFRRVANTAERSDNEPHAALTLSSTYRTKTGERDTFERLRYEAAVTDPADHGARLVDHEQFRTEFGLWTQLLNTRLRLDGLNGAWDIWQGLRQRDIDLPTSGIEADQLWSTFVPAGIQQNRLVDIYEHAHHLYTRTTQRYVQLYELVMRHILIFDVTKARHWHKKLLDIDLPSPDGLAQLVETATSDPDALRAFKSIYVSSNDQRVYDKMITALCEQEQFREAATWHDLCVSRSDFPSSAAIADPLRRHLALANEDGPAKGITRGLLKSGVSFAYSINGKFRDNTKISRAIMNEKMGEIHGVKPKVISDEFSARSLATKAFSVDFVVRGLTAFGLQFVGPLALRQIALRSATEDEFEKHLAVLARCGAKVESCVFSDLVMRLARDRNRDQLDLILDSDMHPDAFEDRRLQERLVGSSIKLNDWAQLYRSLIILAASSPNPRSHAWNVLIRAYMDDQNWKAIKLVFEDMLADGIKVTPKTLRHSFFALLRPRRQPGKRPPLSHDPFDSLRFLTSIWMRSVRSGCNITAKSWSEVHTYYGLYNRLGDVENLSLWLASHYSQRTTTALGDLEAPISDIPQTHNSSQRARRWGPRSQSCAPGLHPLGQLFDKERQSAIIHWSFKALGRPLPKAQIELMAQADRYWGGSPQASELPPSSGPWLAKQVALPVWARGVSLLLKLRALGVRVNTPTVRKVVKMRLMVIWGPGKSTDKENRIAQETYRHNTGMLLRMIKKLHEMWNYKLFPDLGHPVSWVKRRLTKDDIIRLALGRRIGTSKRRLMRVDQNSKQMAEVKSMKRGGRRRAALGRLRRSPKKTEIRSDD